VRSSDRIRHPPPREKVDELIAERESGKHSYATAAAMTPEQRQALMLKFAKAQFVGYPEAVHDAVAAYQALTFSLVGALEPVYR